ncbi:MAG TPA: nucleotide excision repair endonuclease [Vicinamibacterales bacterium]|jgi:predicted GIY-YIG superfamily endonuclease|nr:nucleotide excision repair endonuclease [Vicinamibacterales bacterium]
MLRDKLLRRLSEMGDAPDHQRLAVEVLGIRGAPPDLARKLIAQALVLEDRRDGWRRTGERVCRDAPATPGVYVLKDADGRALYVGKAVNLRRRLRAHFADRRWRVLKPEMSRVSVAEWVEVGSDLEALLREAALIHELRPAVNVQVAAPRLVTRAVPRALLRDVIVIVPSIDAASVELVAARLDGGWMMLRSRRSGVDLRAHAGRLGRFFRSDALVSSAPLAPIVFSWLAHRGASASRLDPHDVPSAKGLVLRLAALLRDERLFQERLEQS